MTTAATSPIRKHRICSYDMEVVPEECYLLSEEGGEMFFCSARCLFLWSAMFVTKENRREGQKILAVDMTTPEGERRLFVNELELAQWAAAHALQGDENSWIRNGTKLTS